MRQKRFAASITNLALQTTPFYNFPFASRFSFSCLHMLNRCEWCVSHANRTTFLSKVMLCCKSKDFLFYVKEMAKWKFKETLRDFAGCLCLTSVRGMLLGLLGHVPSNKQNNEGSAMCGHTTALPIWAERGQIRSLSARIFTLHHLVLSSLTPPQLSLLFLQSLSPFSPPPQLFFL